MNIKKTITYCLLLFACCMAQAHDFVVTLNGQKVYFSVKSKKNKTVVVTYNGSIADAKPTDYEGELTLPAKVKHDSIVYSVVGISAKAFSGADKLTGIILPMGVATIGDFAFEGCSSLSKVIFPGNGVKFGQGVFFKCDKIQHISLGSEWKSVDLKMFRWSDSLNVVNIPAKMERIQNMKSLKNLERISVDINNGRFSAVDGVLYNKNQETLYGCPRAYKGVLKIAEGTQTITRGALVDCTDITRVDMPESLTTMSFREFSRMASLGEIIFRSEKPVATAVDEGIKVFLLQVANPEVKIIVPKAAQKTYQNALVVQKGEYMESNGTIPFIVNSDQLPKADNVKGVKNFTKYEE